MSHSLRVLVLLYGRGPTVLMMGDIYYDAVSFVVLLQESMAANGLIRLIGGVVAVE